MTAKDKETAYSILRLTMGLNMLGHGLARLPKLDKFSAWLLNEFANSPLPEFLLVPYSYTVPLVELLIGVLLVFGLYTRAALIMGGLLIASLTFGSCLIEKWSWASSQMIYALAFFFLLSKIKHNFYALDRLMFKKD